MARRTLATRERVDDRGFVDVSYYDLIKDPIAEVERVYAAAGATLTPEGAPSDGGVAQGQQAAQIREAQVLARRLRDDRKTTWSRESPPTASASTFPTNDSRLVSVSMDEPGSERLISLGGAARDGRHRVAASRSTATGFRGGWSGGGFGLQLSPLVCFVMKTRAGLWVFSLLNDLVQRAAPIHRARAPSSSSAISPPRSSRSRSTSCRR